MGIGRFFKKIGGKIWGGLKKVGRFAGKLVKPVLKVGKFISGHLANSGGLVGSVAGMLNKGFGAVTDKLNQLPDGVVKNKLKAGAEIAEREKSKIDKKLGEFAVIEDRARNKIGPLIQEGKKYAQVINGSGLAGKIKNAVMPVM